jgi:hypothetical protein
VEKVKSFKFLRVNITDNLKWSTPQQRLFNLRRLKKFVLAPKTLTNFYRCTTESILLGCITAPGMALLATAGLSIGWCGLPNASQGAHCLPFRTPTAPDVTGRLKRSRTSTTRSTACLPRYQPEGEVSTCESKLGLIEAVFQSISRPSEC